MRNTMTLLAAVLVASNLLGQTTDAASWQNLSRLAPGQSIEVTTKKGESLKGTFANVSEGSISLVRKSQNVAVPRAEIARVNLRSSKRLKYTLVGLESGRVQAPASAQARARASANESGGDFKNLKPRSSSPGA